MTIFKKMHYLCHTYEGMHSRVRRDIKSLMKSRIPFPADDRSYLVKLIAQGEHQQQDFKYKVMDAVKLARSVSAFAIILRIWFLGTRISITRSMISGTSFSDGGKERSGSPEISSG